jgi:enamidase
MQDHARAELGAAIDEAHKRGLKVTVASRARVTLSAAADLGIDDLEHSFLRRDRLRRVEAARRVSQGREPGQRTIAGSRPTASPFQALVKKLDRSSKVALTSTLTVFETFTPGRPMPPGLDVLCRDCRQSFEQAYQRASAEHESPSTRRSFPKGMALELAFAPRAGGLLVRGHRTPPASGGRPFPAIPTKRPNRSCWSTAVISRHSEAKSRFATHSTGANFCFFFFFFFFYFFSFYFYFFFVPLGA